MPASYPEYAEILALKGYLNALQYQHWLHYELYTWQWWALVAVLIIPWIIWWRLADKSRVGIILAYGLYTMLVVTAMDATGSALLLWIYPVKLLPVVPDTVGVDWGLLTVAHMLIYQYFPRWRPFIIAQTIMAGLFAFVGEPFAEWIGIYQPLSWYHYWSVPLYIVISMVGKLVIDSLAYRR